MQVVGLSMDDNPAIVARFLKERGFNFPTMVSRAYVEAVLPEVMLGQVWLVDEALDKLNHPPR